MATVLLLATLWFPNLSPVGPPSVLAAVIVGLLLVGAFTRKSKRFVLLIGPLVLLVLSATTPGSPIHALAGRAFPDAADCVAGTLYNAFGFGLAWSGLRVASPWHRVSGVVLSTLFCVCLAVTALSAHVALLTAAAWMTFSLWLAMRNVGRARVSQGLCHHCCYDLRGSLQFGRCPECGVPCPNAAQTKGQHSGDSGSSRGQVSDGP